MKISMLADWPRWDTLPEYLACSRSHVTGQTPRRSALALVAQTIGYANLYAWVRTALPTEAPLEATVWHSRHRLVVALLWLHAIAFTLYGVVTVFASPADGLHDIIESLVVTFCAVIASSATLPRSWRSLAGTAGLLASSALLVHLSDALIEMHFHFFVMLAIVTTYESWVPFLLAIAFVILHHAILGTVAPREVFNHPARWSIRGSGPGFTPFSWCSPRPPV